MKAPYRVELLMRQERKGFNCGVPSLNSYLVQQAGQDQRGRVAICYLLIEQITERVVGYYTLSAASIELGELPIAIVRKLPRYPQVPVARIGRLAVDLTVQSTGVGGALLWDAIRRACQSEIAVFAVVVDAKDEKIVAFYERHGFINLTSIPLTLYLPISGALQKLAE